MSKRIEVYFILYLGLLMAFFGIDSEVADYIENQERILEQVAKSKLKNLITINNHHLDKIKDNFNLSFDLAGDFDKDSLDGKLFFQHDKIEDDTFSVSLERELGGYYTASVKRADFKAQSENYSVQITYKADPYFSDSALAELETEFGKKDLVDKIVNNIYRQGSVDGMLTVGMTITPDAVLAADFFIKSGQNTFNSIKGLKGKIGLLIGGVESKKDYTLKIESDRPQYKKAKIEKGNSGAEIDLGSLVNGKIKVLGRRLRDGAVSQSSINVKVQKPRWKHKHKKEVYFNSPFTFDGTLRNLESFDDLDRYLLKVTGDLISKEVEGNFYDFDVPLVKEGTITIQLYIDGNKIDGMRHSIKVKKPPPPQLVYSQNGNIVTIDITAAGKGNKITKLIINKGAKKHGVPEIIDDDQGQNYIQKVKLKGDKAKITLITTVKSNYAEIVKNEKPFFKK